MLKSDKPIGFACMGAWCAEGLRSICQHYYDVDSPHIFERACLRNRADEFVRIKGPVPTPRRALTDSPNAHRG